MVTTVGILYHTPGGFKCVFKEGRERVGFDEEEVVCEELFERFNVGDRGGLDDLRSMSVGDVVVIDRGTSRSMYCCANTGWKPLTRNMT